jgi:subtilisin family serine protease
MRSGRYPTPRPSAARAGAHAGRASVGRCGDSWGAAFALIVLCAVVWYATLAAPSAWGAAAAQSELASARARAFDQVERAADLGGSVRVIVRLRDDGVPAIERSQPGRGARGGSLQRQTELRERAIAGLQDRIARLLKGSTHQAGDGRYRQLPIMAMAADRETLARLRASPDVLSIAVDRPLAPSLTSSVPRMGGNLAWAQGYTGDGQTVVVIDTGVQTGHPAFGGRAHGEAEACFSGTRNNALTSLCPNLSPCPAVVAADQAVAEPNGIFPENSACGDGAGLPCTADGLCWHGTHVAGIAVGAGPYTGVAPGASLISIQVFGIENGGLVAYESDIIAALEYVLTLAQADSYRIAAVNMSLGGDTIASTLDCDLESAGMKVAIDALRAVGVATVVAAGNNGDKKALSFPGCISSAVSVGATDDADAIAGFSNMATTLTVFAPGVSVTSAVPVNGYGTAKGTSMATPHVTGAFAVLREKAADALIDADVDDLVAALRLAGKPIVYGTNAYAVPRIQLDAALDLIALPLPAEIVVDSQASPAPDDTRSNGMESVADLSAYGGTAWRGAAGAANYYRFAPSLAPGSYDVYLWWPAMAANSPQGAVTIGSDGGTDGLAVNQQLNGARWNALGTYAFGGTAAPAFLEVANAAGQVPIMADAARFVARTDLVPVRVQTASLPNLALDAVAEIRLSAQGGVRPYRWSIAAGVLPAGLSFDAATGVISGSPLDLGDWQLAVRVEDSRGLSDQRDFALSVLAAPDEIVIDNDTDGTSSVGDWALNSNIYYLHYQGAARVSDILNATYRFTPVIPSGGRWRAYAWWSAWSDRSSRVQYGIAHAAGVTNVDVDQRSGGNRWNPLGVFTFAPGTAGSVQLQNLASGYAMADAVRLVWVDNGATPAMGVATATLPVAVVGAAYSYKLQSVGGVAPYVWTSNGGLPAGLALSSSGMLLGTPTLAGQTIVHVQVQDSTGEVGSRNLALNVLAIPPADAIVDNDTPGAAADGTWTLNTNIYYKHYQGSARVSNSLTDAYRFTPTLPYAGRWRVHAWWSRWPDRSSRMSYSIAHRDGTAAFEIDQRQGGNGWTPLGVFSFAAGTDGSVQLKNLASGYAMADAVRFQWVDNGATPTMSVATATLPVAVVGTAYRYQLEAAGGVAPYAWTSNAGLPAGLSLNSSGVLSGTPTAGGQASVQAQVRDATGDIAVRSLALDVLAAPPGDVVIDNDAAGTTASGIWALNANIYYKHYQGTARVNNTPAATYRFTPTLPYAGRWRVYAWWSRWPDRSSRMSYGIAHRDGTAAFEIDQRQGGNAWTPLGVFSFPAGADGYVQLQNLASGYVMADAVRFEWVDGGTNIP